MRSLWNDREAAKYQGELAQRVYTSRLLGRDPALVLHGGGNTSVKLRERNLLGEDEEILYVKGSGWDLATIEPAGFAPVRLQRLLALARLSELSDVQMAAELRAALANASAPSPSVEAILHALLPQRFVDHTHADAIITLSNTPHGSEHVSAALGSEVLVLPYVMPGFKLARHCAGILAELDAGGVAGIVLLHHGLITFGETARESYERTVELVDRAERYLRQRRAWHVPAAPVDQDHAVDAQDIACLRRQVSEAMGAPAILSVSRDPTALQFARRDDLSQVAQRGPATPDHVIRTKRVPLIGRDVGAYAEAYTAYFKEHATGSDRPLTMLDPAPRVVLDSAIGMATAGRSVREAGVAADIYRHTMEIIERAELLEEYQALPPGAIFEVEYWDLEQAKLQKEGDRPPFAGEVALVTGAASGIGRASTQALAASGAAVLALDISPAISTLSRPEVLALECDVTDESTMSRALEAGVLAFGGLDMLILNAGVFPGGSAIAELTDAEWERVLKINLDANLGLMRMAHPFLKLAPNGGRVVVIGSKNVPAPGPGAAAYSASKAALTQLARVAALEWGRDGIRVNVIHPNAVFDTGIWTDAVLASRAARYGLSVEEYKRNNVLGVEVTSADVAALVVALCGPLFAKTTGAQIPIDGGNERVI